MSDKKEEVVIDKATLAGLRAYFSPMERNDNARLKKIIKVQEEEISILKNSAGIKKAISKVSQPKRITSRNLKRLKRPKAYQLHLSDTHSREIVTLAQTDGRNEHNAEIGRNRLRMIILQTINAINEESKNSTPVHLTVWGGGDWMVNADLHYKMERCVDDEPLVEMENVYQMLNEELGLLWSKTPTLSNSFVGSFSNHGRDTKEITPGLESHRSYDTAIYKRLKSDFPEVRFDIAETPWSIEDICGFKTMYTHGHVRGCSAKRTTEGVMVPNWNFIRSMRNDYDFNAWVQGHQHTVGVIRGSKFSFMMNGSLVGENSYAASLGYAGEAPAQNLAVIDLSANVVEKVITLNA